MNRFSTMLLLSLLLVAGACSDGEVFESKKESTPTTDNDNSSTTTPAISDEIKLADQFAIDALDVYYLWIDDSSIKSAIEAKLAPETCTDPISTIKEVRADEDRWTSLYDDASTLTNSLNGTKTTMGQYLQVGTISNQDGTYFLIVNYVYPGSPAEKAGVKRGDIYLSYNGADITDSNLEEAYYGNSVATYGLAHLESTSDGYIVKDDKTTVSITPTELYEDPVICTKTFDIDGKKVGYLAYTGFDMKSCSKLIETCKAFKSQGVSELVLDLRYNGGGYVFTEEILASMLAPEANVTAGDVYEKEVYNNLLTKYWGDTSTSYFSTTFSHTDDDEVKTNYSTKDANIGLQKIYALVSDNTASASESILVGLMPYMDIEVIGARTHGKFCTGMILTPEDVYKTAPEAIEDWGIYVMIGSYSDKDGNNPCRPDGLTPDVSVDDNPFDGYQLGDENETMLKAALSAAGKSYTATRSLSRAPYQKTRALHDRTFGMRIRTDLPQLPVTRE